MRRFEWTPGVVSAGLRLPARQTAGAAGYDLAVCETVTVPAGRVVLAPTGVRALLSQGEFLGIFARSSLAPKYGLMLANGVGVVDADYYGNPENGGHIYVPLWNMRETDAVLPRGERVAQAVFLAFRLTDDDGSGRPDPSVRSGGFGSTDNPGVGFHP